MLSEMIIEYNTFGYIIIDGKETVYATVSGSQKKILAKITVELPKKHNKGGQSALRFARLREESIHNYITKVCEKANDLFIINDNIMVSKIILAGSADLKTHIEKHKKLDDRLNNIIIAKLDIAYGGINGLNQAINASIEIINDFKLQKEKNILHEFYQHIAKDTNKIIYGINSIMSYFKDGIIEKIIVNENIEYYANKDKIWKKDVPLDEDFIELLDYLIEESEKYGIELISVSENTSLGDQFIKGFGGLGAILHYPLLQQYNNEFEEDILDDMEFI